MDRRRRLVRSADFRRARVQGRSWAHPLLVLVAVRNELPHSRFGFLVSKRIGKAVVRNRVKRWMREAARGHLEQVDPGWDIVLIARSPLVDAGYWATTHALDGLLRRAGILTAGGTARDGDK